MNKVRKELFTLTQLPYNGENNLLEAIYHERLELAGEGHRFFDLVRTGRLRKHFQYIIQPLMVRTYQRKKNIKKSIITVKTRHFNNFEELNLATQLMSWDKTLVTSSKILDENL